MLMYRYWFISYILRYRYTEWSHYRGYPHWAATNESLKAELYDHATDPDENTNLANVKKYKQVRRQLSKMLRAGWRAQVPKM